MNNRLNLELAKEYYKLAPMASGSFYPLLAVALYFFWGRVPAHILLPWAGINFVVASSFLVTARRFKSQATESSASTWLRVYAYQVLLQDLPWGLIGPMSFMVDSQAYHLLTLFMLGGMTAGGIVTRAVVFKIYLITLFSLLTPIVVILALQDNTIADGMLALVLIYMAFMLFVAKSYSESVNRNIRLWLDKENLVDQLRSSHTEIAAANRVLTREIEHRKQIERELVEAKEKSERANAAKNQFLANVSHELRTPLNGVIGFTELLQDENLAQKDQHYVDQIGKASKSLLRIVNDILDITAIEAGHISFYEETFSLRAELDDLLSIFQPMAERKQLSLVCRVGEGVDDLLCGDASRLRQIISNLLSNALKYTETGRVSLVVSRLDSSGDDKVVLGFKVVDTGIGIEAEALNGIFESFTRLENFETRRNEGAGLGLAIVKTLVNRMGGLISVSSVPGEGSTFNFELAFEHGKKMRRRLSLEQTPGVTPEQWQKLKVLVVDDNRINRMVLTAFLTKAGIPHQEASDGYAALEKIDNEDFDVVLMDIQMPGISGLDVAKRLQAESRSLPKLIAVTAHAYPEQREAVMKSGFADLLIKPIVKDQLMMKLALCQMGKHEAGVEKTQNSLA